MSKSKTKDKHYPPDPFWNSCGWSRVTECVECGALADSYTRSAAGSCPDCGGCLVEAIGIWRPPKVKWFFKVIKSGYWELK